MSLVVKQPTANQTPDATLGGVSVNGASNTGHTSTTAAALDVDTDLRSCRWFGFSNVGGQILSKTLKVTHTSEGALSGATAVNAFNLEYTLNGGGAWITAVSRLNFTAAQGPTVFSVALPVGQDLTQVQVRDAIEASSNDAGDSASATATISGIQIEVVAVDANVVVMM